MTIKTNSLYLSQSHTVENYAVEKNRTTKKQQHRFSSSFLLTSGEIDAKCFLIMEAKTLAADNKTLADPDAKIITGTDNGRIENRGGVSENGKVRFVDDLEAIAGLDDDLEDSEINGVSSLLKMQKSGSFKGLESVLDYIDRNEKRGFGDGVNNELVEENQGYPDGNIEDEREGEVDMGDDNQGHDFRVGDFVWGKIRSHPWWPGRIYDPLDASDYAKKVKQRDKILVAYFGDGTFAWCNPSQLNPLEVNFVEMSKQSSSKNFVNSVEEAVDEVGRLVDLKMTCSCVPHEDLIGFGRSLAVNAGIKDGLLVPETGIDKFSTALFEPAAFVPVLKDIAMVANTANKLEVAVLKNWLSAFYRAKGGYQLPTYHVPQAIPGLEDDTGNWMVDLSYYSGGAEARIQGPFEEDWLSLPTGPKFGLTYQGTLQKCQGILEDRQYQRRKQKSIAEILRGHTDVEVENREDCIAKQETESSKQNLSARRKTGKGKGKVMLLDMDAEGQNEDGDVADDKKNSVKPASSSGRKKKKDDHEAVFEDKDKVGLVDKSGTNLDKLAASSGMKRKASEKADAEGKGKALDVAKEGTNSGKPASSSGRKKKVSDKADAEGKSKVFDMAEGGAYPGKSASSSGRKRKVSDRADAEGKRKPVAEVGISPGEPASSSGRVKRKISDEANADRLIDLVFKPKKRKDRMLSESLVVAERKVSDLEVGGGGVKKESRKSPLSRGRNKQGSSSVEGSEDENRNNSLSVEKKMDGRVTVQIDGDEAKHQIENGSLSRERRQSKYLSPPYTDLNGGLRKKELKTESQKVSSEPQLGEQMTKATGHLIDEKFQREPSKEPGIGHQESDSKQDQHGIMDLMKVAPVNRVLSQVRSTALNPTCLKEGKEVDSLDMVEEFVTAFRSSIYCNGSNYKMYNKRQPGRRRKSLESETGTSVQEQSQADQNSTDYTSRSIKIKKREEVKLEKPTARQAANPKDFKTNDKELDGKAPAAAELYATFSPGSSFPSKNDLIKIYKKFGALNLEETEMVYNHNHRCARIVFLRSSEAEEAFNVSLLASPFGAASVTFQLRYLSAETKTRELGEITGSKSSSLAKEGANLDMQSASQSPASNVTQLNYIRQKLEMMTSMLEMSDEKISLDLKSKLEGEIKCLSEKVSTMIGSSL